MNSSRSFLAFIAASAIAVMLAAGCSPVLNSLTGLTTPQSTISGSNYVFVPNDDGCLTWRGDEDADGTPILAGDRFAIKFDFGFLRYLQAVDPYVLGYAASWMGADPEPTDPEKLNQQILFRKEGVSQNARISKTDPALLGPVTMGADAMPVSITVKIVVLSKYDNAQTISLIDQLAATAAAAQPQYAAAAQAAGAVAGAVIAQNRDKIEFEHSFTFWPGDTAAPASDERHTNVTLRTGHFVVLKGENEARSIPYQTWYYYAWPFNWLGHSPSSESRRSEAEGAWRYCSALCDSIGVRDPDDPTQNSCGPNWNWLRVVPWTAACAVRAPFYLLGDILIGGQLDVGAATPPMKLRREDDALVIDPTCPTPGPAHKKMAWPPYAEKTHIAISILGDDGTFGDFPTLLTRMSDQAREVNELTTNRAEWEAESAKRLGTAFDRVKDAAIANRAADDAAHQVSQGADMTQENFCSTGLKCDGRKTLVDQVIDKKRQQSIAQFVAYARKYLKQSADAAKPQVLVNVGTSMTNSWGDKPNTGVGAWDCEWASAAKTVVSETHRQVKLLRADAAEWTEPALFAHPPTCPGAACVEGSCP